MARPPITLAPPYCRAYTVDTVSPFLYPGDLVSICKKEWEGAQKKSASEPGGPGQVIHDCPPFPSDGHLLELLETVYHLSFLAEEGRRIAVRVIYVLPHTFDHCAGLNLRGKPARLQPPAPLSVGELLKLAPALEATESAITIAPAEAVTAGPEDRLMIWGVLYLGPGWWRSVTRTGRGSALCPPNCLTISSFAPGAVTISTLGHAIARLRNGLLIQTPLPELYEGPIGSFLDPAAQELYRDATKALGRASYDPQGDFDRHPFELYYATLARLLHLVREQKHGGTLVILPDEFGPEDGRLDRLSIKYRIEISVWELLVEECVATSHHYCSPNWEERVRWEQNRDDAWERIGQVCSFVAALSAVDGVVVMSRRMQVLGFGAEIIASSPSLSAVKEALDPDSRETIPVPLQRFGTRHRSAMRMCSSFEDCIALVVSQDGPVKAMKRVGADVVMWNDVTLGRFTI